MPGASAVASQSSRRSRRPCITRDQPERASGLPRDAKAEVERLDRLGQLADRAAYLDGVLLQETEARGRPAGVENARFGPLDRVCELGGLGGNAGQVLQEVEGGPLSPQNTDRRPGNAGHKLATGQRHAVG